MSKDPIFRIVFTNGSDTYELYAREVGQSDMYGFIEIADFVFGEKSGVVIDPGEEKIKNEFAGVNSTYIPMHHVIRIDEVEKAGVQKIRSAPESTVTPFPSSLYTPPGKPVEE
ncbi:MAG: DUF1820 family protein [Gammaproteobacteria bacterium]|nr:DUF1820 family protein [Gammaproteobacteria bacterium]